STTTEDSSPASRIRSVRTTSPIGERQILPMQTTQIRYGPASLRAGGRARDEVGDDEERDALMDHKHACRSSVEPPGAASWASHPPTTPSDGGCRDASWEATAGAPTR